jgi:hypothetical protein
MVQSFHSLRERVTFLCKGPKKSNQKKGPFPERATARDSHVQEENPRRQWSSLLLLPRGKAAFFGYFLCGGKESDSLAQRAKALPGT